VASWWRIVRVSEEKFDPNTVVFLFCTNWAAVDVWRGIKPVRNIPRDAPDFNDRVNPGLGSLGAALNITFWGTFHAQIQLFVTIIVFRSSKTQSRRLLTHAVGLILPSITMLICFPLIPDIHPPALYWYGMDSTMHNDLLTFETLTGYLIMPIALWLIYVTIRAMFPKSFMDLRNPRLNGPRHRSGWITW
jgi:hypothetical protein